MPNFELAQERIKAAQRGDFTWFDKARDGETDIPALILEMIECIPGDSNSYSHLALALMNHGISLFAFCDATSTLHCKYWELLNAIIGGLDKNSPIIPSLIKYMLDSCDNVLRYMTTYEINRTQYNQELKNFLGLFIRWTKYTANNRHFQRISDVANGCPIKAVPAPNPSRDDYMKAIMLIRPEDE